MIGVGRADPERRRPLCWFLRRPEPNASIFLCAPPLPDDARLPWRLRYEIPIYVVNRKHTASFGIVSWLLAIAPLWLLLAAATNSALAQGTPPSWVQAFGSSGSGNNISNAIKVGPDQNLYVTGQFSSTADFGGTKLTSTGGLDSFVARYSPSGALQWVAQAGSPQDDAGQGIDLDADGNV